MDIQRHKNCIGDGIYIFFDGYQYILTTEDKINITNTIYLDANTIMAMLKIILPSNKYEMIMR